LRALKAWKGEMALNLVRLVSQSSVQREKADKVSLRKSVFIRNRPLFTRVSVPAPSSLWFKEMHVDAQLVVSTSPSIAKVPPAHFSLITEL